MKRRPRPVRTRVNDKIRCPEIRVIYGEHNVVLPTWKALNKAKELGLDLVEIAPNAKPPVCRIVDYGKFKYEQAKQKKSDKPKKREKEVKFRVNIDPHDYAIKMMHAEDFLAHGFKVRIQLQFKGRQMAHKELGFDLMEKIKVDLSGMAHIDLEPKLNNRNILMMVSPLPAEKQKRRFRKDGTKFDLAETEAAVDAYDDDDEDYDDDDDDDADGDDDDDSDVAGEDDREGGEAESK
ncbi:MAG: translation initiation factor IF-3 [Verrucomicrobia bacterium]|nr:translation initiation factor IF-3 [Verrucomicrobiota bacterium]